MSAAGRPRHQLLIEFDDGSARSGSIQMYGGLGAFPDGGLDNPYYRVAKEKPSPLSSAFDRAWFDSIAGGDDLQKLSLKALLATNQRIPGLGNGVLQDILFNAGMRRGLLLPAVPEAMTLRSAPRQTPATPAAPWP